jgi:hypothetical protein
LTGQHRANTNDDYKPSLGGSVSVFAKCRSVTSDTSRVTQSIELDKYPTCCLAEVDRDRSEEPVVHPQGLGHPIQTGFDRGEAIVEVAPFLVRRAKKYLDRVPTWW